MIIAAILRDADNNFIICKQMGHFYLKNTKKWIFFHRGGLIEISKTRSRLTFFCLALFCSHIKAGTFRWRLLPWWLCFSQRGSQCSHTSVAARRIWNVAGDSDGKREKLWKKTKRDRGSAGQTELTIQSLWCGIYTRPHQHSSLEGKVNLLILFFRRGISVFIFAKNG